MELELGFCTSLSNFVTVVVELKKDNYNYCVTVEVVNVSINWKHQPQCIHPSNHLGEVLP